MDDQLKITPTEKQKEFLEADQQYQCFSGGFGSGKTWACCLKALLLSQYPGNVGLIGRLTYPELRSTTRKTFFELCPPEYYDEKKGGKWKPSENYLRLINGSEIYFMHMDTVSEKELLSLNIGWFFIDQAEEISEKVFQVLVSRLRLNRVPNRYGMIACNPEPGTWIHNTFKKPHDAGTLPDTHFMIDTRTQDNPHNPEDYVKNLLEIYPEEMARRYVYGDWDAFEGQVFTEFRTKTHVIKPFTPPKNWEFIVGVDHGLVNPTAALLAAIDFDGNIYIIDEYYSPGIVSEHAKAIHNMTADYDISYWLIDPSTRARTREKDGMPWSVLEEYEDYDLFFTPANNELIAGINRVKEFMKIKKGRINPMTEERQSPQLFVFQNCVNLLEEISQYQWKRMRGVATNMNQKEKPLDYNNHAVDAMRYIIMSRFPTPTRRPDGRLMVRPVDRKNMNEMAVDHSTHYKGDNVLGTYAPGGDLYEPLADIDYEG